MLKRGSRRFRFLVVLSAIATLGLMAIPSPAHAVAGAAIGTSGDATHRLIVSAKVTGVLTGTNSIQLVVECNAEAIGAAASTAINECYATSAGGGSATAPSIALPGNAAATAGTNNVALGRITVCVRGTATWLDSSTSTSASGCGTTVI